MHAKLFLMLKRLLIVCLILMAIPAWATHQRAAEITYKWIGSNTYEFTLTCYTYTPSLAGVQRDSLLVLWGDGSEDYIPRIVYQELGDDYTLNVYTMRHDFAGTGTYVISMEDANRNYGVVNVPSSISVPMYIETELVISPFLGHNNSVQLLNAPVDQGCVGKPFYHTPAAYDPDGDSLSYQLVPCKGLNGEDIPGYTYPQSSSLFDIDPSSGILSWENPLLQGEYNIAILIEEWRHGTKVGSVIRDMQILINACNNNVPVISAPTDTCVVAGSTVAFSVSASDPDGDEVTLSASGAPFHLLPPATLTPENPTGVQPVGCFEWSTNCSHIRQTPYQVIFHAKDNSFPTPLTNVHNVNLYVIGPAPTALAAVPQGNAISLSWDAYSCENAEQMVIYRRNGSLPYTPEPCETGVRPGYSPITTITDLSILSWVDDNNGLGLQQGVDYAYRLVAVFPDGSESIPSDEITARLKNDKPLMTHVTNAPDHLQDNQSVITWTPPTEIDASFQAPFAYRLNRSLNGSTTVVYQGADTSFFDAQVNLASGHPLSYSVTMTDAAQQTVGTSSPADPILLTAQGGDKTVSLSWIERVPWSIDSTEIFKEINGQYQKIAAVNNGEYFDNNVENDSLYRYYVRTSGHYAVASVVRPLLNYSAVVEATPVDEEPPCPMVLEVTPDCEKVENILSWQKPASDDIAGYDIYYTESSSVDFQRIETLTYPMDTTWVHEGLSSTVGCYYIVVFDDTGNYSQPSDTVCVDYDACPVYELPNVFTPNGDGINDVFTPIHVSLSAIDHVEMHIFNRWGRPVYDTEDPLINWDGRASATKLECATGTYFFVCEVYVITPTGLHTQHLQGSILLAR